MPIGFDKVVVKAQIRSLLGRSRFLSVIPDPNNPGNLDDALSRPDGIVITRKLARGFSAARMQSSKQSSSTESMSCVSPP